MCKMRWYTQLVTVALGGSDCCNDLSKEWEKWHHWYSSENILMCTHTCSMTLYAFTYIVIVTYYWQMYLYVITAIWRVCVCVCVVCVCVYSTSSQSTGWSALLCSCERGRDYYTISPQRRSQCSPQRQGLCIVHSVLPRIFLRCQALPFHECIAYPPPGFLRKFLLHRGQWKMHAYSNYMWFHIICWWM